MEWNDCRVKQFKTQKILFCRQDRQLTKKEYERLQNASTLAGKVQLNLIMQTICSTGIRVSELQYITVKSVGSGYAYINNKGKSRLVFLPRPLMEVLKAYCVRERIIKGPVFVNRNNKGVSRYDVWKKMKELGAAVRVDQQKIFPHNLRHLFAGYLPRIFCIPFNMNTFHAIWDINTPEEAARILNRQRKEIPGEPGNLEEQAIKLVGWDLYEKLIQGYMQKQWGRKCCELPAFIIKRLPVRLRYDNNYFDHPLMDLAATLG